MTDMASTPEHTEGDDAPRWRPRMLPPYWVALGVMALALLHAWSPGPDLPEAVSIIVGPMLMLAGLGLALWGERTFAKTGTGIVPGRPVTTFVQTGPFRFTRNPMYLGMATALLGLALLLGDIIGLVVPAAFVVVITRRFIIREEAMLRERFGDEQWEQFSASTPRWLR